MGKTAEKLIFQLRDKQFQLYKVFNACNYIKFNNFSYFKQKQRMRIDCKQKENKSFLGK